MSKAMPRSSSYGLVKSRGRQIDGGREGKRRRAKRAEKRDKLEKPGEKNEVARARRKRSGNNEEGESELKARKPSESVERTGENGREEERENN